EQDMNSPEVAQVIDENAQLALDVGATATPMFIVDGGLVVGGQPADLFIEVIDQALAEADRPPPERSSRVIILTLGRRCDVGAGCGSRTRAPAQAASL